VPLPQSKRGRWGFLRAGLHVAGRLAVVVGAVALPLVGAGGAASVNTLAAALRGSRESARGGRGFVVGSGGGVGNDGWATPLEALVAAALCFAKGVAFAVVPFAVHGVIFYVFSQVSHVQGACFPATRRRVASSRDDFSQQEVARTGASSGGSTDDVKGPSTRGGLRDWFTSTSPKGLRALSSESEYLERTQTAPQPSEGAKKKEEWAAHQVTSTLDWNVTSRVWLYLSNGLSHQGTHHLFPQVDWSHYVALAPIIERTAAEFGVPYATKPTLWAALDSHLGHLEALNAPGQHGAGSCGKDGNVGAHGKARKGRSVFKANEAQEQQRKASAVPMPGTVGGLAFLDQLPAYHYTSIFQGRCAR